MSKKTLNEATVRQFMKLVNHAPTTISNFISENYNEEEEKMEETVNEEEVNEVYNEEEEVAKMAPDMEAEEDEDPVGAPEAPADDLEDDAGAGEVDITPEMAEVLIELGDMLKGAMPDAADDMGDMGDMDMDAAPAPMADGPAPEPEDEMMESEVNEEEMVQEVARRVASRILKAKRTASK